MSHQPHAIGEYLLSQKLIVSDQLDAALAAQKRTGLPLGQILVSMRFISDEKLLRVMAAQLGVAPWFVEKEPASADALYLIPHEVCEKHQFLPVQVRGDLLVLAMSDPLDSELIDLAASISNKRIDPVLAASDALSRAIERAGMQRSNNERLDGFVAQALSNSDGVAVPKGTNLLSEEETRPVVGLVNQILSEAIRMGASDVHLEPRANRVDVRYRLDGELQRVKELPSDIMPMLAARLKIMAELDIVETRMPQDGHIGVQLDGREVDIRMSVIGGSNGQRIVLRILDKSFSLRQLTELGMNDRNLGMFRSLVSKPYGMLLVTGPTGSGKTTTLYAALREILKGTTNVMTCEDPIEYEIDGINQSQVNEKIGLTFATQLRALLRQDPDVILVGEIRDKETAETAIRAALTGHLVLSTLHCNDAPSAIPRLLDMSIDPLLLSTCLIGATSQRLVRVLCTHCREVDDEPEEAGILEAIFGDSPRPPIYRAKGCPICMRAGYRGRMGMHELMPVTPEVASAIAARSPMPEVRCIAGANGYEPLQVDAMRRVLEGRTSLAEAKRHVFFENWATSLKAEEKLPDRKAA